MIPADLSGWSLATLCSLLERGVREGERLEFKETLPAAGDAKAKLRLRKAVAGFANTAGGFLVVGVRDDFDLPLSERLVGRPATEEVPVLFGALSSECEPTIDWAFLNPAPLLPGGRAVHVIHVPLSPRRPHGIFEDDRAYFPKRTNRGTEAMTASEIRAAFVDRGRRTMITLRLAAELDRVKDIATRVNIASHHRRTGVPEELLAVRYRPNRIDSLQDHIFDQIGTDEILVRELGLVVENAYASDDAIVHFRQLLLTGMATEADVHGHGLILQQHAQRIISSAFRAADALRAIARETR